MSFIGNITSALGTALKSGAQKVATSVYNPLNIVSAAVVHPVGFVTDTKNTIQNTIDTAGVGNAIKAAGNTAVVASTIAGGAGIVGAANLGLKAAAGIATGGAVTSFVGGVVTASPKLEKKLPELAGEAPAALSNIQSNIGALIEDPSIEALKKIYKENPKTAVALTAGAAAVAGAAGLAVGGIVSNYANTKAIKENTEVMAKELKNDNPLVSSAGEVKPSSSPAVLDTDTTPPALPETTTISDTPKRKNSRHHKRQQPQIIKQSVRVLVQQNNKVTNKRYLNRQVVNAI